MTENPTTAMTPAERWQLRIQIAGALVGFTIMIFDCIIQPPADYATSGFGLLLTGLAPAAVKDYFDRRQPR